MQINQLTTATALASGDYFPLWSAMDQDTRKTTLADLALAITTGTELTGYQFSTRPDFVTYIAGKTFILGTLAHAGGLSYR